MKTILASVTILAACSSSPLDAGAGDSAGAGTKTLTVNGAATAQPNVPDAAHDTDFTTNFSIAVALGTVPVTTGTITITSASAKTELTFQAAGNDAGHWTGAANGYDEVYQLDVISGPDTVTGVRVDGPGIHTITAPTGGASIDSTMANTVTWLRDAAAQTAVLRVDGGGGGNGALTIADTGSFSVPPNTFQAQKDQTRPATVRITRSNQVTPTGAAPGSSLAVGIANEIDVVVLANPNAP